MYTDYKTIIGSKQAHAARTSINGVSPTLTEAMGCGGGQIPLITNAPLSETKTDSFLQQIRTPNMKKEEQQRVILPKELQGKKFRIRKLTPRECFRLMDVDDEDIDKIQASGISNSSQYRLAGNSIVVATMYYIFKNLFIEQDSSSGQQLSLF